MLLSGHTVREYDGILAIGYSLAVSGAAIGGLLIAVSLLAWKWPDVRAVLHPMHLLIVAAQVLDGATTWVGVMNPFDLHLPRYEEQVLLSQIILDNLGGFAYFLLKVSLGVLIVIALEFALQHTRTRNELVFTRVVQLALIVVSFIPVGNNLSNFLSIS